MHRLQEVVRLHRLGESGRTIARQLHVGRNTITRYLEALATAGVLDGSPEDLPEPAALRALVGELVPAKRPQQQVSSVERWRGEIARLREKRAGPKAIHDYLTLHEAGYDGSLSAIKRMCRRLDDEHGPLPTDVAIPVETAPGEIGQVDFVSAGKRYDPTRGVMRQSYLFVLVLGFSRRMFCDLVFDQKHETWLRLHIAAFEHLGGASRVLVPDNLKPAVIRAAFGVDDELVLHRSYRELARHYGCQIDPTPPRSPEKKGKVERAGRYVKGNFLKTWESVDLQVDRRELWRWNAEIADRRIHGTTGRRPIDLFEEREREALLALPGRRHELVVWRRVKVHTDSHVQVDGAFYSVPWRFLNQRLWARCSSSNVVILGDDDEVLWTHPRVPRGQRSTREDHLPEHRRDRRHRGVDFWQERARRLGPEVERLVERIFGSDRELLQLRRVQAIICHLEKFPRRRARAAAARALHFDCLHYGGIKNILAKALDLEPLPDAKPARPWAQGSRHARRPTEFLFPDMESNQ